MVDAFKEALAFAKRYYDAHLFRDRRPSQAFKDHRRELTEEMRLGGCKKIIDAMKACGAERDRLKDINQQLLAALRAAQGNGQNDDPAVWAQIDEAIAKASEAS